MRMSKLLRRQLVRQVGRIGGRLRELKAGERPHTTPLSALTGAVPPLSAALPSGSLFSPAHSKGSQLPPLPCALSFVVLRSGGLCESVLAAGAGGVQLIRDPLAPRRCRCCGSESCDGLCWGFWKEPSKAAAETEGGGSQGRAAKALGAGPGEWSSAVD